MKLAYVLLILAAMLTLSFPLMSQYPWAFSNPPRTPVLYGPVFMPLAATDVWTATTHLDFILLANTTGGAVTVTIKDKSTNCNGGACTIFPATSIPANSTWIPEMRGGIPMIGGVNVQASSANAITTFIRGATF